MTINIPLKAVAFVVYTLALLGGAFGISYAVFEWRDDDNPPVATEQPADPVQAGPSQAELDSQRCEAALEALGQAASKPPPEPDPNLRIIRFGGGPPVELTEAVDRYCK